MMADLFLSSGRDYSNPKQIVIERVRNTPERHLFISAVLGLISIAFLLCPLLVLQRLSGVLGGIANVYRDKRRQTTFSYHNQRALALYQEVGFIISGYNMSKKLN